jgi:hypothetical protein
MNSQQCWVPPLRPTQSNGPLMTTYELRYFFDYGSGTCLWSSNEAANIRFGYPVELDDLDVPPAAKDLAFDLLRRFDISLNWDDPASPPIWSDQDRDRFTSDSKRLLTQLSEHLGQDFRIKDERKIP